MRESKGLRVVPFSEEEDTPIDTSGPPLFTWQDYHRFRNELVHLLDHHGSVGPMRELPILDTWDAALQAWRPGDDNPDFFLVPDMWNAYDRSVEIDLWAVTVPMLHQLVGLLERWDDWCVYLIFSEGALTVFADRILFEGELFAGASNIEDLAKRCAIRQ